jgi:hypothetical protein
MIAILTEDKRHRFGLRDVNEHKGTPILPLVPSKQLAVYQRFFRQGKRKILFGGVKASVNISKYLQLTVRQNLVNVKRNNTR